MSYRTFKQLLGETNLERKCRFMLGGGIMLLMIASFWFYAHQTENIAFEQTRTTGRLLLPPILYQEHVGKQGQDALKEFHKDAEKHWPEHLSDYKYKIIKPRASKPQHKADGDQMAILRAFLDDPEKTEEYRSVSSKNSIYYYGAVRARRSCVSCHISTDLNKTDYGNLAEGDLMAVVEIRLPTQAIESSMHINWALLFTIAVVTTLLIVAGSYLMIRYVIVKPVKHLKEVSDAITAGNLNVRSEIQTGDEFEDLSYAFNRMLRTLMSMQENQRKLNDDLDRKVRELAHANLALFESNKIKSDFLATMSHELRTPMHSILGFSDVLISQAKDGGMDGKQQRWLTNIRTSGQQLLSLINDLLDLAKIESGRMEVHPGEIDVAELCESQAAQVRQLAEKKMIQLRVRVADDLGSGTGTESARPVRQDPVKLRQIVSNLLSNAVKFTPEGGRVMVRARREGDDLVIDVEDTGIGIAPDDQDIVFEKFRQAGNTMTREQGGTGLGLSIVRELCELLGGEIKLHSEFGRGSTFTVRIPAELQGAEGETSPGSRWSDQPFARPMADGRRASAP